MTFKDDRDPADLAEHDGFWLDWAKFWANTDVKKKAKTVRGQVSPEGPEELSADSSQTVRN